MLYDIAKIFLEFCHDTVIIPIIILGFIWSKRDVFYHGFCLIALSILLNVILKFSFQKTSSYGFVFPSGHMQASVVLYGWLAYQFKSYFFRSMIIILLSGIGFSLVYCGYHDYEDIFGGIFFAIVLLMGYIFVLQKIQHNMIYVTLAIATFLIAFIYIIYGQIVPHLWLAYYALIGFMVSYKIFVQNVISSRILTTILCFLSVFAIKAIFKLSILSDLPIYLSQLQWFFIGFVVPFSGYAVNILKTRIQNVS